MTNRIYASVPSSNGSNGNSIGIINPVTHVLENTVFIGSEPSVLAISDDGQFVYAGFTGTSTVRRFNVATQSAGLQFSLGSSTSTGPYYAEDIEVMPGQPNTIAVARRNNGFSPKHEGVAVYDDNVMRSITTPNHTGSNRIEFTGSSSLIGYNNESTEYGIRRLAVNSGGVTNISVAANVLANFYLDFSYHNNRMYSYDGKVVDISGAPFVAGQFPNATGPAVYDTYYNRVCFASYNAGVLIFKRFNPDTFLLYDSLPITQAFGNAKTIVTCGNGCYAFNTTDNKVVIIKDPTLAVENIADTVNFSIFPNPTTGHITIDGTEKIASVVVIDLNCRIVSSVQPADNSIDLTALHTGIYIAKITDVNGNKSVKRIIRN